MVNTLISLSSGLVCLALMFRDRDAYVALLVFVYPTGMSARPAFMLTVWLPTLKHS